jgi:hypothetical protein
VEAEKAMAKDDYLKALRKITFSSEKRAGHYINDICA